MQLKLPVKEVDLLPVQPVSQGRSYERCKFRDAYRKVEIGCVQLT